MRAGVIPREMVENSMSATVPLSCTIPQAGMITGLSRSSIYKLFRAGKLRPLKHGRRTLINMAELHAYIENLPTGESYHASE